MQKLSPSLKRVIIRKTSTGSYSAFELKNMYCTTISGRSMHIILRNSENLSNTALLGAPKLSDKHEKNRLEWDHEGSCWSISSWHRIIFSHKKQFCLNEPDGGVFYWTDNRSIRFALLKVNAAEKGWWCDIKHIEVERWN